MQVFLPYPDLKQSVCCLDPKRLGNQVYRECLTLIRGGWPNHPVAKMWKGYTSTLVRYTLLGNDELLRRGKDYRESNWFQELVEYLGNHFYSVVTSPSLPPWFGDDRLHSSHRAALLYKDPEWYGQFGWAERPAVPDDKGRLPYYWPV